MGDVPLKRRVSIGEALRYRGKQGMLNWLLHRITGLGILLFVGMHVVASFFGQEFGNDIAFAVNGVYESWIFQLFVYFSVLFHAINGTRLALMDLFPGLLRFQKELLSLQWIIFAIAYIFPAAFLIRNIVTGV
jgi:succinate dehydrogenase / fumarate reductase cytochrome b subunit